MTSALRPIDRRLESQFITIDIHKQLFNYVEIKYEKMITTMDIKDVVILEKIVSQIGSEVARGLVNNQQPTYFMDSFYRESMRSTVFVSKLNFIGGPADYDSEYKYSLQFIDITDKFRLLVQTAQEDTDHEVSTTSVSSSLYDFDINEPSWLYSYRIRYYRYIRSTDSYEEYVTDYTSAREITNIKDENVLLKEQWTRPCMTIRNLAYRGLNNMQKYHHTFIEVESDSKTYNNILKNTEHELYNPVPDNNISKIIQSKSELPEVMMNFGDIIKVEKSTGDEYFTNNSISWHKYGDVNTICSMLNRCKLFSMMDKIDIFMRG